jgi:hypothetical protein
VSEEPEGYVGPAHLITETGEVECHVVLGARFEPLVGRVAWYGRVEGVAEVLAGGVPVRLRTPHGEGVAAATEQDLWGHWHVRSTTSAPPFPVEILDIAEI